MPNIIKNNFDKLPKKPYFEIINRSIIVPDEYKNIAVNGDSNSETVIFRLDRFYDGIDLTEHNCYVKFLTPFGHGDRYPVFDIYLDPDGKTIYLKWTIDNKVTLYKGDVNFAIQFETTSETTILYSWQTVPSKFNILNGLEVDSIIVEQYPTILQQWLLKLEKDKSIIKQEIITQFEDNAPINLNTFGKIASVLSSFYDIKQAGAVGDGITDDTASLQMAIDTAIREGKILFISAGNYLLTERIFINAPIKIVGVSYDKTCLLFSNSTFHEESPYDTDYWDGANAAIIVKSNSVTIEHLALYGSTNKEVFPETASLYNGLIFHYPILRANAEGVVSKKYESTQKCTLSHVLIRGFKNGILLYGGWTKEFSNCEFDCCSEAGVKYFPLEKLTVGHWSNSGDFMQSCQFIGSNYGLYCNASFETHVQNCIFEHNIIPIYLYECRNTIIQNCWNEANVNPIEVHGSARFVNGYNINKSTITHTPLTPGDIVTIDNVTEVMNFRDDEIIFHQREGIIVKGVSIGSDIENLLSDPNMLDETKWDLYPNGETCKLTDEMMHDGHRSLRLNVSGRSDSPQFNGMSLANVEAGKTYVFTVYYCVPDKSNVDEGLKFTFSPRNASGSIMAWLNDTIVIPTSSNVWMKHTITVDSMPENATTCGVHMGLPKNGTVYYSEPMFSINDSLTRNNVIIRKSDDSTRLIIMDNSGIVCGYVPLLIE